MPQRMQPAQRCLIHFAGLTVGLGQFQPQLKALGIIQSTPGYLKKALFQIP
jgi:hypothetical protein